MAPPAAHIEDLITVLNDALALTNQLESVLLHTRSDHSVGLAQAPPTTSGTTTQPLDALALASDSASLIKAHATKISLLIINEPFTPTAIASVLRELNASALPGLASAGQACAADRYTSVVQKELCFRAGRVLKAFRDLLDKIPRDGRVLTGEAKNGGGSSKGQAGKSSRKGAQKENGSIATTAVLWSACDDVIGLAKLGVAGYLAQKVEQFRETLKDVMEELQEWSEEVEDEDDEDEDEDEDDNKHDNEGVNDITESLEATHINNTQAMLDDLMNSQQHIPHNDPEKIRPRLDSSLRRLRMTMILYQAIVKRRIRPMPKLPLAENSSIPSRLDEALPLLRRLPELFGSLAMAFYELDPVEIDRIMDQCFFDAFAVAEMLAKPWDKTKEKDEFTDWAAKFQVEIKKV